MLRSMTGYGRGEVRSDAYSCTVEARSVNHRFLDLAIKLPKRFGSLENRIRQTVQKKFSRGRFDITFSWQAFLEGEKNLQIDRALAKQYMTAFQELKEEFGLAELMRVDILASFKDIFQLVERKEDLEKVWDEISKKAKEVMDMYGLPVLVIGGLAIYMVFRK